MKRDVVYVGRLTVAAITTRVEYALCVGCSSPDVVLEMYHPLRSGGYANTSDRLFICAGCLATLQRVLPDVAAASDRWPLELPLFTAARQG